MLLSLVTLAACSGGGDEEGERGISVSPPSISVTSLQGTPVADRTLTITARGQVYVSVTAEGAAIVSVQLQAGSGSSGRVEVRLASHVAGSYEGSVSIQACEDAGCSRPLAESPVIVPVTLEILTPVLEATPPALTFGWARGVQQPPPQRVSLAEVTAGGTGPYAPYVSYVERRACRAGTAGDHRPPGLRRPGGAAVHDVVDLRLPGSWRLARGAGWNLRRRPLPAAHAHRPLPLREPRVGLDPHGGRHRAGRGDGDVPAVVPGQSPWSG